VVQGRTRRPDCLLMCTVVLYTRCILLSGLTQRPDCVRYVVCAERVASACMRRHQASALAPLQCVRVRVVYTVN